MLFCQQGSDILRTVGDTIPVRAPAFEKATDPYFLLAASKVIAQEKPDVVHVHCRRGDTFACLAAKICRTPAVILSRRVDDPIPRSLGNYLRFRVLCDHVIAISDSVRRVLLGAGVPRNRLSLVRSVIDSSQYRVPRDRAWFSHEFGVAEQEIALGVVGQLIERKGQAFMLRAMPAILRRFPGCRLLFFGKGQMAKPLKALANDLGIADRVIFANFREDIPRILPNLDLLVHPAISEGLGVSLLQASAAGVPIVAGDTGGIPEVVKHLQTGWLVPPCDSKSIEEAVRCALSSPDLAARLARNAQAHVELEFGVDRMIEGNLKVYREVLAAKSRII